MKLRLLDILTLVTAGAVFGHFADVVALRQFLEMSPYAAGVPGPALEALHSARGAFGQAGIVIGFFFVAVIFVRLAVLLSVRRRERLSA